MIVNILFFLCMIVIVSLLISLAVAGSKHRRLEDQLDSISDIQDLNQLKALQDEPTDSKREARRKRRANRKLNRAKKILRPRK